MWDLIVSVPDHCLSFYTVWAPSGLLQTIPMWCLVQTDLFHLKFMISAMTLILI